MKSRTLKCHFQYLWYVLKHKWFVFIEACKLGIPWLGIIHDWSKFGPSEWFPYVHFFHIKKMNPRDESGYYKPVDTGNQKFDQAFLYHSRRNKHHAFNNCHHWENWVLAIENGGEKIFDIPIKYRKEMLADWRGAGKAQKTKGVLYWYKENKDKIRLHSNTRLWIEREIGFK